MARVLEAKRVLVQETDRRVLLSSSSNTANKGSSHHSSGQPTKHGSTSSSSHPSSCHGSDGRRRKAPPSEPYPRPRPDSPTLITTRCTEIFGRDPLEDQVEERKIVYSTNDQYGRKEYIGPIVNGKRHGEGVLVYHNNDRCEALFEHGSLVEPTRFIKQDQHSRRHSKAGMTGASSRKHAKTTCLLYHDDPDGFIQYFGPVTSQNKRHGYGSLYCRRGGQTMKFEGNFEMDDLRFGKIIWEDGSVYTGEIHNFLPNGTGRKGYPEGSVYFGHWWNGLRDGHGLLSYPNSDVLECEFNYDKPCGQGTLTWANGRSLSGVFTETGLPQDCTMTATAVWWVSFFGSLTFFLYFNIWAADPCSWSDFMRGRPTWRCTPLSDTYQLALRLNHWYYIYDHFPAQADWSGSTSYLASTGVIMGLDLMVWLVLFLDSITFVLNGLFYNDPFSELHKLVAYAMYKPAVWLYHWGPAVLDRFGNAEDQWTAVLLVSQVIVGCSFLTVICAMNIIPHIYVSLAITI